MSKTMDFVRSVYKDVDGMDVRKVSAYLTEDCILVFGNAPPVVGHRAIEGYTGGFMEMLAGIAHDIDEAWSVDDVVISRMRVTYTRKDGKRKSYPAAVIWRMRGPRISEYRIYVDNSTLFV